MRFTHFAALFIAILIIATLLTGVALDTEDTSAQEPQIVYVGVYAGSTNLDDLKALADEVKSYTNLFVVGSDAITWNYTKLTEICQHLSQNGLNFMVFEHPQISMPFAQWVQEAQQKWSSSFLGVYAYDEPGGYQIDRTQFMAAKEADNYTDAATKYVANVTNWLNQLRTYSGTDLPMFASEYALYEYDYRAGYDAVFAQFGWNFSRPLHVALCRGAATMHDKPWGAIITWTYNVPPYIESGKQMYEDMVYAYENGAEYILVFDYDKNTARGILQQEHLAALKQFWQYVKDNPRTINSTADRVAYVLPADYGFGFRSATDKVWGIWEADSQSAKIWSEANSLITHYASKLDIIYEDSLHGCVSAYGKLMFWNGTVLTLS